MCHTETEFEAKDYESDRIFHFFKPNIYTLVQVRRRRDYDRNVDLL